MARGTQFKRHVHTPVGVCELYIEENIHGGTRSHGKPGLSCSCHHHPLNSTFFNGNLRDEPRISDRVRLIHLGTGSTGRESQP